MEKTKIMLVDDHTLIRQSWAFLMSMDNRFEVVAECGDGEEAVESAKKLRPDIVLLDINMSPLNGFEVLKLLRKYAPASKIIGVSMHVEPPYVKKLFRMGAKGYVTKNSTRDEMIEAISEVKKGNVYICREVQKILDLQKGDGKVEVEGLNSLSERELQIVGLLGEGHSSKEIAEKLHIALKTVDAHRHHILKKMKLDSTVALIKHIHSQAAESYPTSSGDGDAAK
jgi:two-component system invasion response regulator UvrY